MTRIGAMLSIALLLGAVLHGAAAAQDAGAPFSGFNSGSDEPIQIEADRLEVRDNEKLAIYTGHVRVLQGGTLLEAPELHIFYKDGASADQLSGSQVTRIEAFPGVKVRSGDQVATAARAVFEMDKDLITMTGNVVLTQGQSVVRGDRLVVNLTTKEGRIEGGRVQTLITPSGGAPARP